MIVKEITPEEVARRLRSGEAVTVVDVREPAEWAAGHIRGSLHIPLGHLFLRLNELDERREIIVVCRSGNRSGLACEMLAARGYKAVNMAGGLLRWPDPELLTAGGPEI